MVELQQFFFQLRLLVAFAVDLIEYKVSREKVDPYSISRFPRPFHKPSAIRQYAIMHRIAGGLDWRNKQATMQIKNRVERPGFIIDREIPVRPVRAGRRCC